MFSKGVGVRVSNEVEVLVILEAMRIYSRSFLENSIMESDSFNAISWVANEGHRLWKLLFCFDEIKALASHLHVAFPHVVRSAKGLVDALAKTKNRKLRGLFLFLFLVEGFFLVICRV